MRSCDGRRARVCSRFGSCRSAINALRSGGAKIYAELLGLGSANEIENPRWRATGRTMARAIRAALTEAAVDAGPPFSFVIVSESLVRHLNPG